MQRKYLVLAAFALIAGAAILFGISNWRSAGKRGRSGFV